MREFDHEYHTIFQDLSFGDNFLCRVHFRFDSSKYAFPIRIHMKIYQPWMDNMNQNMNMDSIDPQ